MAFSRLKKKKKKKKLQKQTNKQTQRAFHVGAVSQTAV